MSATSTTLDSEELLHLAIRASQANRHEEAIGYLKRATEIDPKNGRAYYMLGAEHAEIGMYDRAVEEMAKAVAIQPELSTAHFQLGLLHITSARIAEAEQAWKPLDKLKSDDPLRLFKDGLLHLARDEFDQCVTLIEKGIPLNRSNEALNNDMRRVIQEVKSRSSATPPTGGTEAKAKTGASHVLLSAYRSKDEPQP
jgi:tetratricopeptide (TPR) repeat protein